MIGRRRPTPTAEAAPMSRTGIVAVLGGGAVLAGALVFGLGYSLHSAATRPADGQAPAAPAASGMSLRDQLAAAPMLAVDADAGRTPQAAISLPPPTTLPAATTTGPAGVPSGFPHTPLGAVAQLVALEVHVLTAMSLPTAVGTYQAWGCPSLRCQHHRPERGTRPPGVEGPRQGGKVVLTPLPPAVQRAIERAVAGRTDGAILRNL